MNNSVAKSFGRKAIAPITALVCLALVSPPSAIAQPATLPPMTAVRNWTLAGGDLSVERSSAARYRLRLEMATVSGTRWAPAVMLEAARGAAAILAQCDVEVSHVRLHEFDGPPEYRYLSTPVSREFARRSGLRKPVIFFVDDTRQHPAFDAEAIGRGNARARPEMEDTVWITAAIRDLPVALTHELVHVLTNSGDHSDAPDNLMREETAPGNTVLSPAQCDRITATGQAHGLIEPAADTRR